MYRLIFGILIFLAIRFGSFFTQHTPMIQGALVLLSLTTFAGIYYKKPTVAFILLIAELLWGGGGQFFQIGSISIRTLVLITFLLLWSVHMLVTKRWRTFLFPKELAYTLSPLFLLVLLGVVHGLISDHPPLFVFQDALPYGYFLLILPALSLIQNLRHEDYQKLLYIGSVFVLGTALFSLIIFFLFASGIEVIHDPFYKWFRDIALGKITDTGTGFFRIVLPEHLLIPIVFCLSVSARLHGSLHRRLWTTLLCSSIVILTLNFSRAYFLGIFSALLFLAYTVPLKKWLKETAVIAVLFASVFMGSHLLVSGGTSFGFELLGVRFGSIAMPSVEESAFTRTMLLRPIALLIQQNPIFGHGLGSSITFWSPFTNTSITTRHFDWGYLEVWAELGIFGLTAFIAVLAFLATKLWRQSRHHHAHQPIFIGILAAVIAMNIIHVFTPAFFHVFGIVFLVGTSIFLFRKAS